MYVLCSYIMSLFLTVTCYQVLIPKQMIFTLLCGIKYSYAILINTSFKVILSI